jgi:hypothetical protein
MTTEQKAVFDADLKKWKEEKKTMCDFDYHDAKC